MNIILILLSIVAIFILIFVVLPYFCNKLKFQQDYNEHKQANETYEEFLDRYYSRY